MSNHLTTTARGGLTLSGHTLPRDHPVTCYLAVLREGTSRRTMLTVLKAVAGVLTGGVNEDGRAWGDPYQVDWSNVGPTEAAAIRAYGTKTDDSTGHPLFSASYSNLMLCAFRRVVKETWRLGWITAEHRDRTCDFPNVTNPRAGKGSQASGRVLSDMELLLLFNACRDGSALGLRDAAVLALGYAAGLRRAEIVGLDLEDVDTETGAVNIRRGKGGKSRLVYVQNGALVILKEWIELRGDRPGPLLWPISKKGELIDPTDRPITERCRARRLTTQAVFAACQRRRERANEQLRATKTKAAPIKPFSPHDLRRTYITALLSHDVDTLTVSELAGHSSTDTTRIYDRRGEGEKRAAANRLHIPWQIQA